MPTVDLQFTTSDTAVSLQGAIFDAKTRAALGAGGKHTIVVIAGGNSNVFTVPKGGNYWYEFSIDGGTTEFTLTLKETSGKPVVCLGNPFDPNDGTVGRRAAFDVPKD